MDNRTYDQIIEGAPESTLDVTPEFVGNLVDVIKRDNTIYNTITNPLAPVRKYLKPKDPTFDKTPHIGNYDPSLFERAWDVEDINRIKNQVDYENELTKTLADSSTSNVLTARLLSGVMEPMTLISIASGGAGGALITAGRTALNAAAAISAQELLLHGYQLTRTMEESAENIIAGTVLSGALGALIGKLSPTKQIEVRDALKDSLGWTSESSKIASSLKVDTALSGLPAVRTSSYTSNSANQSFEKLLKSKLYREKNLGLNPSEISAETLSHIDSQGDIYRTSSGLAGNYAQYRKRMGGYFSDHLNFEEFKHEVSKAGHRGAVSDIPEAAKVAKFLQDNILNKYHGKLVNSRLMDPLNVQTTDASYFPTSYNAEKMKQDRPGFIKALVKGFQNTFEKTALSINDIEAKFKTKTPGVQKVPTKGSIEDNILGMWRERLQESGIDSNGVEYVPTKFADEKINILYEQYKNKDQILKERLLDKEEFKKEAYKQLYDEFDGKEIDKLEGMYDYMTSTPESLNRSAEDVYNLQTGNSPASRGFGIGAPKMTKSRMDVSREDLFDYLNLDAEEVVSNYIRQASGASEVAGKYLSDVPHNDLVSLDEIKSSVLDKVHEDYRGLINSALEKGNTKLGMKLEKEQRSFNKDFSYYFDLISGRPMDISNYEYAARAGAVIRKWNNATLMGNVTVSSLNEPIRLQISNGILNTFKDLPDHLRAMWSVFRNARPKELQEAGIANNMFMNSRVAEMQQLTNTFSKTTGVEKAADVVSKGVFKASMINAWSDYTDITASTLFSRRAIEAGEKLAKGKKVSNDRLVEFASYGLSPEDLKGIHENYTKYGDLSDFNKYMNIEDWADKELAKRYEGARSDAVGTMLVKRTAASIPQILQDTEVGRMAAQYQNWTISASTDLGLRSAQQISQGDVRGLTQIVGQVLSSVPIVLLKAAMRGVVIESTFDLLLKAIDEGGVMGIYGTIMDKTNEMTGHKLSTLIGETPPKGFNQKKSSGEILLGPSGRKIDDIMDILADTFTGDVNRKTIRKARSLLPAQNIFVTKKLFDEGQEAMGNAFRLPEKNEKRG